MDTNQLLYLLMSGQQVDIGQIIANEIRNVAESGKEFGAGVRSTHPLVYPSLIMGFLIGARVRVPNVVPFEIKTKVNDIYVERYFLEKKKKRRRIFPDLGTCHFIKGRQLAMERRMNMLAMRMKKEHREDPKWRLKPVMMKAWEESEKKETMLNARH
ncbi:unnamed protein product [Vicia faba]|uniref:Uncharacterized protein n=1 Tax=Vicia faba TaxID=3906 RepID=A0AAV0YY96_VICFA|nr:unnamed protein product [Vicia faba]